MVYTSSEAVAVSAAKWGKYVMSFRTGRGESTFKHEIAASRPYQKERRSGKTIAKQADATYLEGWCNKIILWSELLHGFIWNQF